MEAMASGMPIVCTKIRGNTDLIQDGVSGMFVENSPQALAEAIRALYAAPQRRAALGQGAAEAVRAFDAEAVHQRMKEIYLSV